MKTYIAAVGFEVDRIVLPAIKNKADRVWLLTHNGLEKDKGDVFVRLIVVLPDIGDNLAQLYVSRRCKSNRDRYFRSCYISSISGL